MTYDYSRLVGKMAEHGYNRETFAKALGISRTALYSKLNSWTGFTQKEILSASDLLNIEQREIPLYFFTVDEAPLIDVPEGSDEPDYGPEKIPRREGKK